LLDSLKIKLKIATFDEFVWTIAKRRYLKIAKRFLDFERQWVKNNPNNHIHELEKKFQIVVHNLLSETEMGQNLEVVFQGTIDRIETDKNLNVLLVDYKRSTSAQGSATSWIKENTLQLLFYGWLVQKYDLLDTKSLLGLVYYDYQRMNRKSSLIHRNAVNTLLSGDQADVDPQENQSFLQYFTDLELEIKTLVLRIVKNDFHPEPLNENDCPQCSWRSLCRAPHLNH
ncbi:MAG: PD-(D/E)XK nuclease family protein, partial [Pseudobdellovibrionaceae bacterium]